MMKKINKDKNTWESLVLNGKEFQEQIWYKAIPEKEIDNNFIDKSRQDVYFG
jgi:hypothetical protein